MKLNNLHFILSSLMVAFLTVVLFRWAHFLSARNYIQEQFENINTNNVNMPFQTSTKCQNPCTSMSSCLITGEQCQRDIDCQGCLPKQQQKYSSTDRTNYTVGEKQGQFYQQINYMQDTQHNGNIGGGGSPDMMYRESSITKFSQPFNSQTNFTKPPEYSLGTNEWKSPFDAGYQLYNKRFTPPSSQFQDMLQYPEKYTLSGEFEENGALPYNY